MEKSSLLLFMNLANELISAPARSLDNGVTFTGTLILVLRFLMEVL